MKKFAFLGAAAALGAAALLCGGRFGHAADHLDAPTVQMTGNQMADIDDVYAWMSPDGAQVNLAMTVDPAETSPATHAFGPDTQYVWHLTSRPEIMVDGTEQKVICTFASNTSVQCWVAKGTTTVDYVKGDPSNTAGATSKSGKMKVFAGLRSDPFFFNLAGFKTAVSTVESASGTLVLDKAGCPAIDAATAGVLRGQLTATPATAVGSCPAGVKDCFASFNAMAIVLSVDKSLLNLNGNTLLSVWGSTHMAM